MAFIKTASPAVVVNEIDLTRPGLDPITTNVGAFVGPFQKGPVGEPVLVKTESELINAFGYPTADNYEYWWSVSNFLEYGGVCYVVRPDDNVGGSQTMKNAVSNGSAVYVKNSDDYLTQYSALTAQFVARTPGAWGNNIGISVIDAGADQRLVLATTPLSIPTVGATITFNISGGGTRTATVYGWAPSTKTLDIINVSGGKVVTTDTLEDGDTDIVVSSVTDWYDQQVAFGGIPWRRFAPRPTTSAYVSARGGSNDLVNIIVYDRTGQITGSVNTVLESFIGVSKLKGATSPEGDNIYFVDAIAAQSSYVYATAALSVISTGSLNTSLGTVGSTDATKKLQYITIQSLNLSSGVDNLSATLGEIQSGYDYFEQAENFEIDFLIQGPGFDTEADTVAKSNYLVSIAETRRDCMAFVSPPRVSVLNITNTTTQTNNVINWANQVSSSSYVVLDSGYKYTYDRFRDVYVYVPLNADIAGLMVNTARVAEQWYSPAGLTRGQIRNAVRLPYNPTKTQRDDLYVKRVNPVVSFPGEGVVLFGDKTGLASQSAFNRINVRKLFLVLERTISKAARAQLFEFNDEVTRALFRNLVDPFLREVQSKRGITDYLIVCDASNNTGEVIDRNEFVADIYIKPARSINFVTLNFVATRTGTSFAEATGLFRGQ